MSYTPAPALLVILQFLSSRFVVLVHFSYRPPFASAFVDFEQHLASYPWVSGSTGGRYRVATPLRPPILIAKVAANNVSKLDVRRYLKVWTTDITGRILERAEQASPPRGGGRREAPVYDGCSSSFSSRTRSASSRTSWECSEFGATRLGPGVLSGQTTLEVLHLLGERPLERTVVLKWDAGKYGEFAVPGPGGRCVATP